MKPLPCTTIAARVEHEIYDQVTDLAKRARVSRSAMVRRLLRDGIKRSTAAYDGIAGIGAPHG